MIRINVIYKNNQINKITIKGHANFAEYGKDIVCASVSSTYLCTVNAILALKENSIDLEEKDNLQTINVKTTDKTILTILQNMINCLTDLEKQYPKYLKIDKEEK